MSPSPGRLGRWLAPSLAVAIAVMALGKTTNPLISTARTFEIERPIEAQAPTPAATPADANSCDPVAPQFARMFAALADAALANADKSQGDLREAIAADRVTLERYLALVGLSIDESELDAAFGVGLTAGSGDSANC
jgi:hypothetical protein